MTVSNKALKKCHGPVNDSFGLYNSWGIAEKRTSGPLQKCHWPVNDKYTFQVKPGIILISGLLIGREHKIKPSYWLRGQSMKNQRVYPFIFQYIRIAIDWLMKILKRDAEVLMGTFTEVWLTSQWQFSGFYKKSDHGPLEFVIDSFRTAFWKVSLTSQWQFSRVSKKLDHGPLDSVID